VEEPALLVAVQWVVGRVQVEHHPLGRHAMRVEEEIDQQTLDRRRIMGDLAVALRADRRMLEPVERALAGERCAVRPPRLELAGQHRHHRVVAQLVVVDHVFITERDPDHPLTDQRRDGVLDARRIPAVAEAGRKALDQTNGAVGCPEQQRTGVRGHCSAVEPGHHRATVHRSKRELARATVCRHRGTPLQRVKSLSQKNYRLLRAPMHLSLVRNADPLAGSSALARSENRLG